MNVDIEVDYLCAQVNPAEWVAIANRRGCLQPIRLALNDRSARDFYSIDRKHVFESSALDFQFDAISREWLLWKSAFGIENIAEGIID